MKNIDLIASFSEIIEEKQIDQETLVAILTDVFRTVLKKEYGTDENLDFVINPDKGDVEIWRNRIVVEDGNVNDSALEISLSEARKIESDFEIGEEVSEKVVIEKLGRRAIMGLGQNLRSKFHDYDNTNIYRRFKDIIGQLYSAEVHHVRDRELVLLDTDGREIILPKRKQISSDFYRKGDTVWGVVENVELKGNKPLIIMSRTSPKFLEKLLEHEIPEISDGLISIQKIVRRAGEKAKVAVDSYDERIDPVGACVGVKGNRIQNIVKELGNENIDVINYSSNPSVFISRALSPAKISSIEIDEENKAAKVLLSASEVSKAIGKNGINIQLANQLTGYEIDVFREEVVEDEDIELIEFEDEIDTWIIQEFQRVGLDTAKSILEYSVQELVTRTDLEEETIEEVVKILKAEFEK